MDSDREESGLSPYSLESVLGPISQDHKVLGFYLNFSDVLQCPVEMLENLATLHVAMAYLWTSLCPKHYHFI